MKLNTKVRDGTFNCSFCAKSDTEVEALVAGPQAFICDICARQAVEAANQIKAARVKRRADALETK